MKKPRIKIIRRKMPTTKREKIPVPANVGEITVANAVERFRAAFEDAKTFIFEREQEIDALALAILTGEHVMLEGKHGIAKSMLANQVFGRIHGSRLFHIQMMKGTQPDEVFGPMNSKIYREEGQWVRNTPGFMPECEFAFLDETYRGPDGILGSLLGILNEREYHNGPVKMKCPLITAIGTTNFTSVSEELDAFHDRWLIRAKVEPLQHSNMRMKMLNSFVNHLADKSGKDFDHTITLNEIQVLRENLSEISIEPELLEVFEELCRKTVANATGQLYISDRRLCLTLKLVMAQTMIEGRHLVLPEHLNSARFGLGRIEGTIGNPAFDSAFQTVVGEYENTKEETAFRLRTDEWTKNVESQYDPELRVKDLAFMRGKAVKILNIIQNFDSAHRPKREANIEGYKQIEARLEDLVARINSLPKMKGVKNEEEEIEPETRAAAKVRKAVSDDEDEDGILPDKEYNEYEQPEPSEDDD